MKLSLQRRVSLSAMIDRTPAPELEEECNAPLSVLQGAAKGEDIPLWDYDWIVDAIERWDAKGDL